MSARTLPRASPSLHVSACRPACESFADGLCVVASLRKEVTYDDRLKAQLGTLDGIISSAAAAAADVQSKKSDPSMGKSVASVDEFKPGSAVPEANLGFNKYLVAVLRRIVAGITIRVTNVHIRLEEGELPTPGSSNPTPGTLQPPFALGVSLGALEVISVDQNALEVEARDAAALASVASASFIRKKVTLSRFSVYVDSFSPFRVSETIGEGLADEMAALVMPTQLRASSRRRRRLADAASSYVSASGGSESHRHRDDSESNKFTRTVSSAWQRVVTSERSDAPSDVREAAIHSRRQLMKPFAATSMLLSAAAATDGSAPAPRAPDAAMDAQHKRAAAVAEKLDNISRVLYNVAGPRQYVIPPSYGTIFAVVNNQVRPPAAELAGVVVELE
ncbi:MAG: hypothetical protein EOO41_04280, partial [Methanobacteriota archaeon]